MTCPGLVGLWKACPSPGPVVLPSGTPDVIAAGVTVSVALVIVALLVLVSILFVPHD